MVLFIILLSFQMPTSHVRILESITNQESVGCIDPKNLSLVFELDMVTACVLILLYFPYDMGMLMLHLLHLRHS